MVRSNWTAAIFLIDSLIGSYNMIWYFDCIYPNFSKIYPHFLASQFHVLSLSFFFFLINSPHSSLCWHLLLDVRLSMEHGQPLRSQILKGNWLSLPLKPAVYGPSFRVGLVKPSPLHAWGLAGSILCQFCKGKQNTSAFVSKEVLSYPEDAFLLWSNFISFCGARDWT